MALITAPFSTNLVDLVAADTTAIRAVAQTDLCDTVTNLNKNVVITVFDAAHSELMLVTSCYTIAGVQYLGVQRGFGGTTPRAWPVSACICLSQTVDKAPSLPDPDCHKPLSGVQTDGCLEIIDGETCAPTIRLKPTGVVPVNNGCIIVNACGLVEWVSPNFPYDCLPTYEACSPCAACGGTTGTGSPTATSVTFNGAGNTFVIGPDVASALNQIDVALENITGVSGGLVTVTQGDGIIVTGNATDYEVALAPIATPGVYNGFTINEFGQVTDYDLGGGTIFTAVEPLQVVVDTGTNEATFSVDIATDIAPGVVQLVDETDISAHAVPVAANNRALTWKGVLAFRDYWMPKLLTGGGISGSNDIFNTDRTLVLKLDDLTPANTIADTSSIPFVTTGGTHGRITVSNLSRDIGCYASAIVNIPSTTIVSGKGVSNVTKTATGEYQVDLAISGVLPATYVVHAVAVNNNNPLYWTYQPLSSSKFELRFYKIDVVLSGFPAAVTDIGLVAYDPPQIAFQVMSAA